MTDHETPAFDTLARETSSAQADTTTPPEPGDHRMEVLTAIREGRTVGPQRVGEHVVTLAALGFDIETVAEALDLTTREVEAKALAECNRIATAVERSTDDEVDE